MERSRDELHKRLLAEALSEQFGLALLAGEPIEAEQVAREALEAGIPEGTIYDQVVRPAMHRIGRLWQSGEISVAHEHLATQIATRVLVLTHEAAKRPARRDGHLVLLAAVEGELHVMGLDMAGKLLESAGYDVRPLGPDVPLEALAPIVADHNPSLFVLSATMPDAGERLPAAVDAIASEQPEVGVIAGGAGVRGNLLEGPRLSIESHVSRVVDSADALTRRADLN